MKKTMLVSSETHFHPLHRSARKFRYRFALSTLLLAATALLGPGGGQRCAAQYFPPIPPGAPSYQWDESTFSIGVFQIQVVPNFTNLFAPATGFTTYYPGFSPSSGILTSPVMYDNNTMIGTGPGAAMNWPGVFPVTVGNPAGFGVAANNPGNQISGTGDYSVMPIDFAFPTYLNPLELCTEIESFDLSCDSSRLACGADERVPNAPATLTMVSAGPLSGGPGGAPFDPSDPANLGRRSLGMVQQQTDPVPPAAKSFFNINVQVDLPAVANTISLADFPFAPLYYAGTVRVAQLTNDPAWPLVIINPTNVTKLPPDAVYYHGVSETAVPLYFMTDNPPYWTNGALFGSITLAGHGVFACTNGGSSGGQDTNCCVQIAAQGRIGGLLDQTLGPVGNPRPPMPVAWPRTDNSFPNTNTTYKSLVNTVVTSGQTNVLDAAVGFTNLPLTLRDLVVGSFPNPIALPAVGVGANYSATNVPITLQIVSTGGATASAGTGAVTMVIYNTGLWSQTLTNTHGSPPPVTIYTLQLANFAYHSTSGTPLWLRLQSATPSVGQHTVRQTGGGYKISSFFDVWLQMSTDNSHWYGATNSLRLLPSLPPVTVASDWPKAISISLSHTNNQITLSWPGTAILQNSATLIGGWSSLNGGVPITGSYTTNAVERQVFYRLLKP